MSRFGWLVLALSIALGVLYHQSRQKPEPPDKVEHLDPGGFGPPASQPGPALAQTSKIDQKIPDVTVVSPPNRDKYGSGRPYVELQKPASFGKVDTRPVSSMDYPQPKPNDLVELKKLTDALESNPNDRAALAQAIQFLFAHRWFGEAVPYVERYLAAGGNLDENKLIASVTYGERRALQSGLLPGGNGAYIRGLATLGRFQQARTLMAKLEQKQPGFADAALFSVYLHYYEFLFEGRDKGNIQGAARALVAMNDVYPTAPYLDLDTLAVADFVQMLTKLVESKDRPSLEPLDPIWAYFPPHILQPLAQDLVKAGFRPRPALIDAIHPLNDEKPCEPSAMIRRSWFAYARAKDPELAYHQARAALKFARLRQDDRMLLFALWNLSDFAQRLGDLALQADCVKEAQTLSAKFQLDGFRVETDLRLGVLQEQLADDRAALETFSRVLELCRKYDAGSTEFKAVHAISSATSRIGDAAVAEPTLRSLVRAAERASSGIGLRAGPYLSLGCCLMRQGKLEESAQFLSKASKAVDPQHRSRALLELGRLNLLAKQYAESQQFYTQALDVLTELDDPEIRWQALTGHARVLAAQGKIDAALQPVAMAMDVIDAQRSSVADYHRRRTFQSNKEEPYHLAVQLALKKDSPAIAYAVAERARARTLLDTLNAQGGKAPEVPTMEGLQRTARGIAVVVFLLTETEVLAWVASVKDVRFHRLAIKPRDLYAEIGGFLRATVRSEADTKARAVALHRRIWAPLLGNVQAGTRICIVPHGFLHYLPFQSLHDGSQYAIERNEIFYAPSGSALTELRGRNVPVAKGVLLADPILSSDPNSPFRSTETAKLREFYPASKAMLQDKATVEAFCGSLNGVGQIHVSSHGYFNHEVPARSGLVFSKPTGAVVGTEVLTAERIAALNLRSCNLVVLSACVSSVGELAGGDEVTGVTRAFQAAGATNVIGSLWPVENDATTELMIAFYTHLKSNPDDPTGALCKAQREAIQKNRAPSRWAAFEINGPGYKKQQ